ncbi:MAG: hypothetical protein ACK6DM_00830 [Alphaproteobacteria bacterium]|jgi:hypothetical protein
MAFPARRKDDGYDAYKRQVGKHETTRPSRVPTTVGAGREKRAMYWETDPEKIMEFRKQYIARYGKEPDWDIEIMPGGTGIFGNKVPSSIYGDRGNFKPAKWKSAYTKGRPASKPSERAEIRAAILRAIETGKSDEIE